MNNDIKNLKQLYEQKAADIIEHIGIVEKDNEQVLQIRWSNFYAHTQRMRGIKDIYYNRTGKQVIQVGAEDVDGFSVVYYSVK